MATQAVPCVVSQRERTDSVLRLSTADLTGGLHGEWTAPAGLRTPARSVPSSPRRRAPAAVTDDTSGADRPWSLTVFGARSYLTCLRTWMA